MGANHARVIAESDRTDLAVIVDPDHARVAPLAKRVGCEYSRDIEAAARALGEGGEVPGRRRRWLWAS